MNVDAKNLGAKLRYYREKSNLTLEDTADAVELDADKLVDIEAGDKEVDEELLSLLIAHFKLKETEAVELWELAGYQEISEAIELLKGMFDPAKSTNKTQVKVNIPNDVKVLYSDMVQVSHNKYGVILNFIQSLPDNQGIVVSRIGLSKEHAKNLSQLLINED